MKSKKLLFLIMVLFMGIIPFLNAQMCGDVNGDGSLDIDDIMEILIYLMGGDPCMVIDEWPADVDCSGVVDVYDVIEILKVYVGIPANINCCVKPDPCSVIITFPDPNLERGILATIGKPAPPIYLCEVQDITFLDLSNYNISDITGIEHLTALKTLILNDNNISDINPIRRLTNLTYLRLARNDIRYIDAVMCLKNLTFLSLSGNEISDIQPLSGLTNLIHLGHNRISDIGALQYLTELTHLNLFANSISIIDALQPLINLTYLNLYINNVEDIQPLYYNYGMDNGDEVILLKNPLNNVSLTIYIPYLQNIRSVNVVY